MREIRNDHGRSAARPADGVIRFTRGAGARAQFRRTGHHVWTDEECAAFERRWARGTRERLAFDLLLYTGLRRGDAVRLGRPHVRSGIATIRTEKIGEMVTIPVLPPLLESIDAGPVGELTFICGVAGRPMTKESFGNFFREACSKAGVPGSAHGLRKAGATRAANNGATEAQLALFSVGAAAAWPRFTRLRHGPIDAAAVSSTARF